MCTKKCLLRSPFEMAKKLGSTVRRHGRAQVTMSWTGSCLRMAAEPRLNLKAEFNMCPRIRYQEKPSLIEHFDKQRWTVSEALLKRTGAAELRRAPRHLT